MRRIALLIIAGLFLTACDVQVVTETQTSDQPMSAEDWEMSPEEAARNFTQVVRAVEPVAERECRRLSSTMNCDFLISVDPDPRAQPNAYQSEDDQGRPVLTFTASLIGSVRNADEMAFVVGHEAAHHISNHLQRQQMNATAAAEVFGGLATLTGGGADDVASAQKLGAEVGARAYSKDFELEADELGTIITYRAGYDPLVGAEFFTRIPDPGDRFLGSHPPNSARVDIVSRTVKSLGG